MIGWMQPTWTPAMISRQRPTKIPSLRTTPGGERTPGRLTLGILGRGVPASGLQPAGKTIAGVPTRPRAAGDPHFKISRRISRPNWREPYTSPCQARISVWKSLLQRRAASEAPLRRPPLFPRAASDAPPAPLHRSETAFRISSASSLNRPSRAAWAQWGQ